MRLRLVASLLFAAGLSACSGGGGGGSVAPASGGASAPAGSSAPQAVQLNVHIPGSGTSSSSRRSPQYVASSTAGVLIQVYATSDTTHSNLLASSATNVSSGSTACGGASGARTCSVSIPAPAGTDDFVFTTYDQPPSSGTTFPGNANVLATGTVHGKTIVVAQANVVNVTLSGVIASLTIAPWVESLLAGPNGTANPGTYSLVVTAFDSDNNVIIAGSGDPYSTPITVTAIESAGTCVPIVAADCTSGATGHTSITLGGPSGTGSSSVQLTQSGQVVTAKFDGRGDPSYHVTFQAQTTSALTAASFTPMYVDSTSAQFTAGVPGQLSLNVGQTATINLREFGGQGFTLSSNTCAGIVTATAPVNSPVAAAQLATIVGGSTGGTCALTYSDGITSWTVNVVNSATTANIAVPGQTLAYLPAVASGVSIRIANGTQVGSVATSPEADGVALDDAGNLYVLTSPPKDSNGNPTGPGSIAMYVPSGSGYPPVYTKSANTYTLTDPNDLSYLMASGAGEVAALEYNGTIEHFDIWDPGQSGTPSRTITLTPTNGQGFFFGYVAHNGNLYTAALEPCGANSCLNYLVYAPGSTTPTRTITESIVPQANQSTFVPNYIAVGPDGTIYVTEYSFFLPDPLAGLYIIPPSGPERFVSNGAEYPQGVDLDGSGNIYVANSNISLSTGIPSADTAQNIAVLSPDGGTILRRITGGVNDAIPVVVAADGTAFFSDYQFPPQTNSPGVFSVAPGATSGTLMAPIQVSDMVLWNGATETTARNRRGAQSLGAGSAHAGGFALHRHGGF
jgi:hypothetical protein